MKICLIGGSGFVGTNLITVLRNDFSELINIDKQESSFFPEITSIADVRDVTALNKHLAGQDIVILLAAEHRDDVSPVSDYYDVNVTGTENVLKAMDLHGIEKIIFTSSVAVYGLNKENPSEEHSADPFNHYGKSKWQAEEKLRAWFTRDKANHSLTIIRPTVIFGENNRGNVYNLLKQISSGRFMMIGRGDNYKSMAYVKNIVAFIKNRIEHSRPGYEVFNYVDKPDFTIKKIISVVEDNLSIRIPSMSIPKLVGVAGGYAFDIIAFAIRKKLPISSVRVKKFCATTQFEAAKTHKVFNAPYTLLEGLNNTIRYEFSGSAPDEKRHTFQSE